MSERKSAWGGVSIHNANHQSAIKSWFEGLIAVEQKVIKANVLERLDNNRASKLRVLVEDKNGKQQEFVRSSNTRGFSIISRPPSSQRWA